VTAEQIVVEAKADGDGFNAIAAIMAAAQMLS
jgi:hypothetical protein